MQDWAKVRRLHESEEMPIKAVVRTLARLNCDQGQGYHLCCPVPAAELDELSSRR